MQKGLICVSRFSLDDIKFICLKSLDNILLNENRLTKGQIVESVRNLRDEIERYC
jgi:hypothetical protein